MNIYLKELGKMKIRKLKKAIKKLDDKNAVKRGLTSVKLLIKWSRFDHPNSKSNMRIITKNVIYVKGKLNP